MIGRPWDAATLQAAMAAIDHDFTPLTDLRASSAYRQQTARNLLRRLWLETRDAEPLQADQTSVWARAA
jgi:xanthine dehydrogenase small subunit